MRRSLIVAALLTSTAITFPKPAYAMPPVVGFIQGAIAAVSGSALLGGSLLTTAGFGTGLVFGSSIAGALITRVVLNLGISAVLSKLAPKPGIPEPSARLGNYAQPISYAEHVFGRTRKGGPLGFTGFQNLRRYYVPILAAHPIQGVVEHWFDERVITLNDATDQNTGNVVTAPMTGYGRVNVFDGRDAQVVDPGLDAAFSEITAAHDFKGLSGAVIWAKRAPGQHLSEIYPGGKQWAYAPVIDGHNAIYDPRDTTHKFTDNAALIIAHWATELCGFEVDWDDVAQEANICDAAVLNREGSTQPKWTINGTLSDDQDFEDQRAQLAGACDAFFYERSDGKLGFRVGRWIEPEVTLTASDFLSFETTESDGGLGAPDEVAITYTEPESGWREAPSGTWVENVAVKPVREEPRVYLINNHNQASRVAKRLARVKRAKYQLSGSIGLIGYELVGQRFFRVVHEEMGFDEYFEVGELTRQGVASFSIVASSTKPEDHEFVAATEEPSRPAFNSVVSNDDIPDVTGLTASAVDGPAIDFAFDAQDQSFTQQIRLRPSGSTVWQTVDVNEGQNQIRVSGLTDATTYEYQARNRTATQRVGDWAPDEPDTIVTVANSTPPAAHVTFSAALNGSNVDLVFAPPNDANYFATRIYRATDSTDFNAATLVHTEYLTANWTDLGPGVGDQSYWVEPINASGRPGPQTGPETITIS